MQRYVRIAAAVGLVVCLLGIGAVVARGAEVEESVLLTHDSGSLVYPYLVNCRRCHVVRVVDTGNRPGDGTGKIISERARCRCDVEFRVDRIPNSTRNALP